MEIKSLVDLAFEQDIPEDHETLEENARQKALFVYEKTRLNCFADDTGLEVTALRGAPGVYSARYAGPGCSFGDNIEKLLREMRLKEDRSAAFRTVIALVENGIVTTFEGIVHGEILAVPSGQNGFGYDPVFRPTGSRLSFAEMSDGEKNALSHRSIAVHKLAAYLLKS